uniref:40S ribosomal protein S8 n=1 Tax=Ananas comosus var. bracteatus TaxID=296719 RepID=A0A6V7NPP5_ANACO|nr:unnamed protein product [Ananas comosus var. bracteatus]
MKQYKEICQGEAESGMEQYWAVGHGGAELEQKVYGQGKRGRRCHGGIQEEQPCPEEARKAPAGRTLDPHIEEQFGGGRLLACISSRPGQCGRADGYILEGKELEFYTKKIQRKKGKGGAGAAA